MSIFYPARRLLLGAAFALAVSAHAVDGVRNPVTQADQTPFVLSQGAAVFSTQYATLRVDAKGFVTSITAKGSGKDYSPAGHPSPLLSLHENGQPDETLLAPVSAAFDASKKEVQLTYPNGSVAVVKAEAKDTYFRFQLLSLTPRGKVDVIVWGPVNTNISGKIGDIIGVVRDDDFAIGLYGLNDNTVTGAVADGAGRGMSYEVHSPDPKKYPLPGKYKEGQKFQIGGNGKDDVAYFSRPEEYFRWVMGTGADLKPEFGSSIAYHSRDRRRSYTYFASLLPGFEEYGNRHMVSDPIPGVDFIGSGVALYACPDEQGLKTIEKIILAEGLPYITIHGKWVRDPTSYSPTVYWNGPMDKAIEYTKALGMKDISCDTGGWYPNRADKGKRGRGNVGFSGGKVMPYKEFTAEAHKQGVTHGGLHTLCMFLQGGQNSDVTPVPSEHLQTVCRTNLTKDISPTDTQIVVTDPSFLAERGTWPKGKGSNYLRIGGEMLYLDSISDAAPWTLKVRRGCSSKALAHKAGDELVKLMQNCYNGFVPDMTLVPEYADYYAEFMVRNGMDTINFDGFESAMYQQQGYYGVRVFCRRLFETYHKLSGGQYPRVTASCVFGGSWEYLNVCDLGGGDNMFNPVSGRRATEGKDIGNAFSASYYPATFGIQNFQSGWNLYQAENLQAKAVGWDATYALSVGQAALDNCVDRDAIFTAFQAWQNARAAGVFTKEQKLKLRNPDLEFHLEQSGESTFALSEIKQTSIGARTNDKENPANPFRNTGAAQPLDFVFKLAEPHSKPVSVEGLTMTLPDGTVLALDRKFSSGETILCRNGKAHLIDASRKRTEIPLQRAPMLPEGDGRFMLKTTGSSRPDSGSGIWTIHVRENTQTLGQ